MHMARRKDMHQVISVESANLDGKTLVFDRYGRSDSSTQSYLCCNTGSLGKSQRKISLGSYKFVSMRPLGFHSTSNMNRIRATPHILGWFCKVK